MLAENSVSVYNLNSRNPGDLAEPIRNGKFVAGSGIRSYRPKTARRGKRCDATIVITERLAQNLLGVLAQHGRRDGIDDGRLFETDRLFDVRHEACGRVRDLADAMPLVHLTRIEGLLDGAKIADGDVGRLHLRHPVLANVRSKNPGKDRAQFLLVGRSRTPVGEFAAGEIGPAEHFNDEA